MARRSKVRWGENWGLDLRLWIEQSGAPVMGPGRPELLESIDRHHSISAAARQLGISYRHAWRMVQSSNDAAGEPLVTAEIGGPGGGGAQLTEQGRWLIARFRELNEQVRQTATAWLARLVQDPKSEPVHVAAAVSLEKVLGQLLGDYALQRPAVRVRTVYGASDELADHILAGAPADLLLTADPLQLDRLGIAGLIVAGTRLEFAANGLAAIGAMKFRSPVHKPADLANRAVARLALAAPSCPLGGYTRAYLARMGLSKTVLSREVSAEDSRGVVTAVRSGRADVGLVYSSDADETGCRLLFRARRGLPAIRFQGAVVRRGRQPEEAGKLLQFLTLPAARRRFRICGFWPPRRSF